MPFILKRLAIIALFILAGGAVGVALISLMVAPSAFFEGFPIVFLAGISFGAPFSGPAGIAYAFAPSAARKIMFAPLFGLVSVLIVQWVFGYFRPLMPDIDGMTSFDVGRALFMPVSGAGAALVSAWLARALKLDRDKLRPNSNQ